MSFALLAAVLLALALSLCVALSRRVELERMGAAVRERERARRRGIEARLLHPVIDLSRCLGCGTCVAACPEDGVLALVHGQASVVRAARCEGIAACERECPTGAITVTIARLESRRDVPVVDERLEAAGVPGLFLAGELTAHALIKRAIEQGTAVARAAAERARAPDARGGELDLAIVGAGPAGLACALEARRLGLAFTVLEQEDGPGGAVAKYPRRKLVLTQPVELPLHGRLGKLEYAKEELMALWAGICAEQRLPLECGVAFEGLERAGEGFVLRTSAGERRARSVCLALGRRGTPQRLDVPGEELPKVAYSLVDAGSHAGRRLLVVGGGDSAVEAALGLAEQPGTRVTLAYRGESFFRIRARNEARLEAARARGDLEVLTSTRVVAIQPDAVVLECQREGEPEALRLANDELFVLAGGVPPFELLERSGVSFDPALRPPPREPEAGGSGLVPALAAALGLAAAGLAWVLWHLDYYALARSERAAHLAHDLLRPSRGAGLAFGIGALAAILVNLAYLLRRGARLGLRFGSLRAWMTSHVATGVLALVLALLHGAMQVRDSVGGHAFWALVLLLATGAVGRWLYAFVPRAANGRELELGEARLRLERLVERSGGAFQRRVQRELIEELEARRWKASFLGRLVALARGERGRARLLARLAAEGEREGLPPDELREALRLARALHRAALAAAHLEDLRAVMASWRYFHRWIAALMVLLVGVHVVFALVYGEGGGGPA